MQSIATKSASLAACRAQVEARLKRLHAGETVAWDELETLTALPRETLYRVTSQAKRSLLRSDGCHLITREGLGIERLSSDGARQEILPRRSKAMVRAAKSVLQTASKIDLTGMDQSKIADVCVHQTVAALTVSASDRKSVASLRSSFESEGRTSPLGPAEANRRFLALQGE